MSKRVHIIDPNQLRTAKSANDNKAAQQASGQARVRLITPDKPVPACQARKRYVLPHPSQFSEPGLLDSVIDRFLADDAAVEGFHHQMVRFGIVGRFQHALDLASDPEASANGKRRRALSVSRGR